MQRMLDLWEQEEGVEADQPTIKGERYEKISAWVGFLSVGANGLHGFC